MKSSNAFIAFAFAVLVMLTGFALAVHEVERRPEAVCVPLYDRSPLECWSTGPECPAPKGEEDADSVS